MIVQSSYDYVRIGLCLRLLRNVDKDDTKDLVTSTFKYLQGNLQSSNFVVTLSALNSNIHSDIRAAVEKLEDGALLGADVSDSISNAFKELELVVYAEATTKKLYVLPNRRFNSEYLLNDPSKLLKGGAFQKLDDIAKSDFVSSCRCLLFGESTAAAFHILRATESVLKSYYYHYKKRNRLALPMWGPMVQELRALTRQKPSSALLTSLDLIRSVYRNPTQHPELTYEIDAAQDLFGVCLDVIGKMTDVL
jgi:hypothetical protein